MEDPGLPGSTPCGRAFLGSIDGKGGENADNTPLRIFHFNTNALIL